MKKAMLVCLIGFICTFGADGKGGQEEEKSAIPIYMGIGMGYGIVDDKKTGEEIKSDLLVLQVGFRYTPYVALEGRFSYGVSTDYEPGDTNNDAKDYDGNFQSWGVYMKPSYPIDRFQFYLLLGYGGILLVDLEKGNAYEKDFQWGVGGAYKVSKHGSIFVDYLHLYEDEGFDYRAESDRVKVESLTVGFSYKF